MNEVRQQGQFYLTWDHNLTTETHTHTQTFMWPCMIPPYAALAAQTKVTKYQWVKVTDRQRICIRQDPIVVEEQKSSGRPGWLAPFVTHSHRRGETDRYTWISATRSCSLTHKLHCPFHLRHPVPCQLFIHRPATSSQWAALFQGFTNRSTQTKCGCLDILTQPINTSSAPDVVSVYSHQIKQSAWTCPLNSLLVSSSVMS